MLVKEGVNSFPSEGYPLSVDNGQWEVWGNSIRSTSLPRQSDQLGSAVKAETERHPTALESRQVTAIAAAHIADALRFTA